MGLFAAVPVEEVTVQDIATEVDMTPMAIYYHFASKEQILLEGMRQHADELLGEIRSALEEPPDGGVGEVLAELVGWASEAGAPSAVYFVNSIGLNQTVEALRREVRAEMVELLVQVVKVYRKRLGRAEAGVIAVALVSLLETSVASALNRDVVHRGIGTRRFGTEVAALADRIAGIS